MIKYAFDRKVLGYRRMPSQGTARAIEGFAKIAGAAAEPFSRIAIDPSSHYYLDSWAVSAFERFGLNENSDGFERDQLKQAHRTFVGSWVCVDHENWDERLAIGTNVDAVYMPDDYVRVAMAVERRRSEARRPGLEAKIERGEVTDTSMGVFASSSACTICGNVASDELDFCDDVRPPIRGSVICDSRTLWKPVRAGELNRGLLFFEDTIITSDEGADNNAKILAKLASASGRAKREVTAILEAIREVSIGAGPSGTAILARLVHRLNEVLN